MMVRFEYRCGLTSIVLASMWWMSCARGASDEFTGEGGSSGTPSSSATGATAGSGGMTSTSVSTGSGGCTTSADCAPASWCSGGNCLPCNTHDHCGPACTDCTQTGMVCDGIGACVECATDAHCAAGNYCNAGSCAPCDTAAKCGPMCEMCGGMTPDCVSGACECNPTSCDPNQMCTAGICEVCKTDAACGPTCSACAAPTPLCLDEGMTSQCVECLTDADCQGGLMCLGNICADACTLTAQSFDFEADDQGFTHAPTSGIASDDPWARGFPTGITCHGGSNCWATGLSLGGYLDCQTAELVSPVIDLSPCAGEPKTITFSFWHYYQFEPMSANRWYDGGTLQLSTDSGVTWTDVVTSQPYQGLIDGDYALSCSPTPDIAGHQGWSGIIPGSAWVEVTVILDATYLVPGFRARWLFGSDGGLTDRGWFIDDVAITVQ